MARRVNFQTAYLESDRPWHPSSARREKASERPVQDFRVLQTRPLSCNTTPALAVRQAPVSRNYEDVVAEADALLQKVGKLQPAEAAQHDSPDAPKTDKKKASPQHNKLAIVRVRVCPLKMLRAVAMLYHLFQ